MGTRDRLLPAEIVGTFLDKAPVDVAGMAKALSLKVAYEPLPDDVSGKIECELSGPCKVTVNTRHSKTRQRFTLAHEIAHYVLHRDLIGDGIVDDGMYRSEQLFSAHERQANNYAARTLMPVGLMRQAWDEGIDTAQGMAIRFDVSAQVAEIRMREVGCLLWPKAQRKMFA